MEHRLIVTTFPRAVRVIEHTLIPLKDGTTVRTSDFTGVPNPFPPFAPVHPNASSTFILPITYQYFDPHWHIGHTRGYNFTIEHQFARNLVARASFGFLQRRLQCTGVEAAG